MLLSECDGGRRRPAAGHLGRPDRERTSGFRVDTAGEPFDAEALVIATGGLSIPKMGATGFGYGRTRSSALNVLPTRAGLVPLHLRRRRCSELSRTSPASVFDAEVRCNGRSFREAMLFTHRGLSGPAILQISSFWQHGDAVEIDLLPGPDVDAWLKRPARSAPRRS